MLNALATNDVLSRYCLLLYATIRQDMPGVVVEIGRKEGHSTYWMSLALSHNGAGVLHSIDIEDRRLSSRLQQMVDAGWLRCHVGDSHGEVGRRLAAELGEVDALYIDGQHNDAGIRGDCDVWMPLAPPLIIIHDWNRYPSSHVRAIAAPYIEGLPGHWGMVYWAATDLMVARKDGP